MHTCHSINHLGYKNLDEDFTSTEILPKLHNDTLYTPKAIQIDIKTQFGIEIDNSGLAKSRAISYFRSLDSWEFGHGEPSHERATTKARLGLL